MLLVIMYFDVCFGSNVSLNLYILVPLSYGTNVFVEPMYFGTIVLKDQWSIVPIYFGTNVLW